MRCTYPSKLQFPSWFHCEVRDPLRRRRISHRRGRMQINAYAWFLSRVWLPGNNFLSAIFSRIVYRFDLAQRLWSLMSMASGLAFSFLYLMSKQLVCIVRTNRTDECATKRVFRFSTLFIIKVTNIFLSLQGLRLIPFFSCRIQQFSL